LTFRFSLSFLSSLPEKTLFAASILPKGRIFKACFADENIRLAARHIDDFKRFYVGWTLDFWKTFQRNFESRLAFYSSA
jgi:hypothetical protein